MKFIDYFENINNNDTENINITFINQDGLDMMLEGFGAKIKDTDVVIVSGALISPHSEYENDYAIDASLTVILDCTDNTPDILYWESESNEIVALYNYLTYLGCMSSYDDIENIDVELVKDLYENAAFEKIFAA